MNSALWAKCAKLATKYTATSSHMCAGKGDLFCMECIVCQAEKLNETAAPGGCIQVNWVTVSEDLMADCG